LIKIEIEGMEQEALAGGRELIAAYHPILIVEWLKSRKAELQKGGWSGKLPFPDSGRRCGLCVDSGDTDTQSPTG